MAFKDTSSAYGDYVVASPKVQIAPVSTYKTGAGFTAPVITQTQHLTPKYEPQKHPNQEREIAALGNSHYDPNRPKNYWRDLVSQDDIGVRYGKHDLEHENSGLNHAPKLEQNQSHDLVKSIINQRQIDGQKQHYLQEMNSARQMQDPDVKQAILLKCEVMLEDLNRKETMNFKAPTIGSRDKGKDGLDNKKYRGRSKDGPSLPGR